MQISINNKTFHTIPIPRLTHTMKLVLSENMSQVNVVGKSKEKLFDM